MLVMPRARVVRRRGEEDQLGVRLIAALLGPLPERVAAKRMSFDPTLTNCIPNTFGLLRRIVFGLRVPAVFWSHRVHEAKTALA